MKMSGRGVSPSTPKTRGGYTPALAVLAVLLMVTSASILFVSPGSDAEPSYRHYITYHANGGSGSDVTVSYDGIAATEYNPLYWSGSFADASGADVTTNWTAPTGSTNYNNRAYTVAKVFAGWSDIPDYTSNSAAIYDPGDVVPSSVTNLYAVWAFPYATISGNNAVTYVAKGTTLSYEPSDAFSKKVSEMYTRQYYFTENTLSGNLSAGSYRSQSYYTGGSTNSTVNLNGRAICQGDVIIDHILLGTNTAANGNHGYSTNIGIYGNGFRLILGSGITNAPISDPLRAPVVFGGGTGDTSRTTVSDKGIVSQTDSFNNLRVNLGSFVIIHSGTYYAVMAGGREDTGTPGTPLSTYLVFKKATVIDTVGGGNTTDRGIADNCNIYGSTTYATQFDPYQGGTFVYAIGLFTLSDIWAASETGYSSYNSVDTNEGCNFQGGCSTGQVYGSTHVFVSGTSSLWDVQGGGRAGNAFSGFTYVEISGSAEVRHAACGSVTDGTRSSVTCTNGTMVVVRDNPTIAMLFGAGYDTWTNPTASNMANGKSITVDIAGGTIGFVYGGGYRGTIGSSGNTIEVSVSITGGTVVYDVFGGGRGGVDKMLRTMNGSSRSTSVDVNTGYVNSSGCSIVYGNVDVNIGGDAVIMGNVYAGGESVPLLTRYYGITNFRNNDTSIAVAEVTGNTSVTVSGNALVYGSVYGAGKGINISDNAVDGTYEPVTGSAISDYYTKNITVSKSYSQSSGDYQIGESGRAFHFLDWYNHSSENGSVTYNNSILSKYLEYAMTEKTGSVTVTGDATIRGSVYGGGAFSRVLQDSSVSITGGEITNDVFGGGLGRVDINSVNGNSSVSVNGGDINGNVYGGSAYGIVGSNATVVLENADVAGDVYGGGLGVEGKDSVLGNTRVTLRSGEIGGTIYGGSAYGIVSGDLYVTIENGRIGGSVYGGGLGRVGYVSTHGKRYVYIQNAEITGSVFGGSSVGDDKVDDSSISYDTTGTVTYTDNSITIPMSSAHDVEISFNDVLTTPNSNYRTPSLVFELYDSSGNKMNFDPTNYINVDNLVLNYDVSSRTYSSTANIEITSALYSQSVGGTQLSNQSGWFIRANLLITDYSDAIVLGTVRLAPEKVEFSTSVSVSGTSTSTTNDRSINVHESQNESISIAFNKAYGSNTTLYLQISVVKGNETILSVQRYDGTISYGNYFSGSVSTAKDGNGNNGYKLTGTLKINSSLYDYIYDGKPLSESDGYCIKLNAAYYSWWTYTVTGPTIYLYPKSFGDFVEYTGDSDELTIEESASTTLNPLTFNNVLTTPKTGLTASAAWGLYSSTGTPMTLDSGSLSDYITVGTTNANRNAGSYTVTLRNVVISSSLYDATVGGKALSAYSGYYLCPSITLGGTTFGSSMHIYPVSNINLLSDALVVISEGSIGQSVYGGGFMGNTYGSTAVYIGYTYDGVGTPQPNAGTGDKPVITIGSSVYAGGDVGESDSAFTVDLVHGDGSVYVNGSHTDITIPGSIMASGNSCLTAGATTVELWYFDNPVQMLGVHRADTVLLYATILNIGGIYSQIGDVEKMCSLSHIGSLTLQAGSAIYIANPIEDVGEYHSLTREGTNTTTSSPFNKVVFTAGSTLFIRSNDGTHITYGAVTGYTILSVADNAPFGGYVLGSVENSTGGFVTLKEGSYLVADHSDYSGGIRCWFITGVESKVLTLSLPYGDTTQKVNGSVDIIKLQDTSNLVYTGGTFIPYNDGYSFGRPGTCSGDQFGLMFGYMWGDGTTTLVSEKQHYVGLTPALTSWKYSTFFMGETAKVDESGYTGYDADNPAMNGVLNPVILRTGTVSGTSSASPTPMDATFTPDTNGRAGTFSLNLQFCGLPADKTDYVGYVILYIQEVISITIVDSEGEHTENMVSNRIELRVDLYTIGSTLHRENNLAINTVDGEGDVTFLFNTGRINQSVYILSSERSNDESGVSLNVQGVRNVGNNTGWKDTVPSFAIDNFNNEDTSTDNLLQIGTLNGGYMGTVKFSVSGFDKTYNGLKFTVVLVLKDADGNFIQTSGGEMLTVTLFITIKERDRIVVTFYDYTQGVTADTGGIIKDFGYGTLLSEAQCPPVLENFIGWYQEETFINVYSFNTPLVRDISLYARYTYTVTFDYQNGTTSKMYVASTNEGVRIAEPAAPSMTGYTFDGWYKQSTCIEAWDFSTDRVTGNVTLYAKWVGENVRVIFKDASGTELDYRITAEGSTLVNRDLPAGTLTGPFVRYGETFNVLDLRYSSSVSMDVNILDGAKTLLDSTEIFIKWVTISTNGKTVAIYADSVLDDTLIDIENAPTVDGIKVIYLSAITSPIAVHVVMEAITTDLDDIIGGNTDLEEHLKGRVNETDLSASVTAPSDFLIYPDAESDTENGVYLFTFVLNDATRPGWTLYGWHNTHVNATVATYPAAGLERVIRLTTEKADGHTYVMEEDLYKNGAWVSLTEYDGHTTENRLDDPSNPYTIRYIALWDQIAYTVTISNTAHGIVDAYYINSADNTQTPGTTFTVHYGDRIKLVFTPDERYDFYRWTYYGECLIEDASSPSTTMVVTGDAIIYASDTGERVVRLYATFDGDDDSALDELYLQDSVTGEYVKISKNSMSDMEKNALYRAYVAPGTYYVCIKDGDDVYTFGTAVVGSGETTYYYTIHTVQLDIKDGDGAGGSEVHPVDVGNGVASYSKYVGKERSSDELLYGYITVSEGYTYNLHQGYIDGGDYEEVNNLGNDEVGVLQDTILNYRLSATVDNTRIVWGIISPITFTVSFVVGNTEGDISWIDGSDNIRVTSAPVSVKIRYGENFGGILPDTSSIGYTDNTTSETGTLFEKGYVIYNWYTHHKDGSFVGAVYGTTRLDAAFISEFSYEELSNNSFSLYSWIIKDVNEITISYTIKTQTPEGGYETSETFDVTFISLTNNNTYTGIFSLPSYAGFKDYLGMDYKNGTDLGRWMKITYTYPGATGDPASNITVTETDVLAEFTFADGLIPDVELCMTYDRLTTRLFIDLGEYGELDTEAVSYLLDHGWSVDGETGNYCRDARLGEVVYAPTVSIKPAYSAYYEFGGWTKSGGAGSLGSAADPGSSVPVYSYEITLADVNAYKTDSRNIIVFSAVYNALSVFALTMITPVGKFRNGQQRYTVYLTPAEDTGNFLEVPIDDSGYYTFDDWDTAPPVHLTYDVTIVAQWIIQTHTLNYVAGEGSENYVSLSATRDQYSATSGGTYTHHSEIILTIKPVAGYTLDVARTLGASTASLGEPTFVSEDRGFRWVFFLDDNVSIKVYMTKATIPVHFLVNGNIWKTEYYEKYAFCYFDQYSEDGYSSTTDWFTDAGCNTRYTEKVTDPADPNHDRYYIQVLSETAFYTTAEPNTYFIVYHPNNETETAQFDADVTAAIAAYLENRAALPGYIQAVHYGSGFRLNNVEYAWTDSLMCGWSLYSGDSVPDGRIVQGRITNLMQQTITTDFTDCGYDSASDLYASGNGVIHMYAYYVALNHENDLVYDGEEHSMSIVKKTYTLDDLNLTVYYSTSLLNAANYDTVGSTVPVTFTDAGQHMSFYYGWVNIHGDEEMKSVFQGSYTLIIGKRTVTFVSGSAERGFIAGQGLSNEDDFDYGGVVAGEESGLTITYTYEDASPTHGSAPIDEGNYHNTFTVSFDGRIIKSTNYEWTCEFGTLKITASSDSIKIEKIVNKTYGDSDYTMVWSDDGQASCLKDKVTYASNNLSVVTVDEHGTLSIHAAGNATIHVALKDDPATDIDESETYVDVQVIIAKKGIDFIIILDSTTKIYDGTYNLPTTPTLDADESDIINDDDVTFTLTGRYADSHAGSPNLDFTITLGGADRNNYTLGNVTKPVTGTITPRSLIITTESATKEFDNTPLTAGYTLTGDGFVSGQGFSSVSVTGTITNVGMADNTLGGYVFNSTTTRASDYTVTENIGTLTVTVRHVTIPVGGSRVYTGDTIAAAIATSPYYTLSGEKTGRDKGDYTAYADLNFNTDSITNVMWNDDSTEQKTIIWYIVAATLNWSYFTFNSETHYYDSHPYEPSLVYTGPEANKYVLNVDYAIEYVNNTNATVSEGSTYLLVTGLGGYVGSTHKYEFTITPRSVNLIVDQGQSYVYDRTEKLIVYTESPAGLNSGFLDGHTEQITVTDGSKTNAGTYTAVFSITGGIPTNYSLHINGTDVLTMSWKIAQKQVDVTLSDTEFVYNGLVHDIVTSCEGLIDGDDVEVIRQNEKGTDAGDYLAQFILSGASADNYIILIDGDSVTSVSWVIEARPILIIASSAWKTFDGTALTSNGYSSFGILPAQKDQFTITITGSQEGVGSGLNVAACQIGSLNENNYDILCVSGTLIVINPVSATVTSGAANTLGAPAVMAAVSPGRRWLI